MVQSVRIHVNVTKVNLYHVTKIPGNVFVSMDGKEHDAIVKKARSARRQ